MNRVRTVILAIALILGIVLPTTLMGAPSYAADRWVYHYSPDDGYDAYFLMECPNNGGYFAVYEGQSSQRFACATGHGLKIFVDDGKQIKCRNNLGIWFVKWDVKGWYLLSGGQTEICVHQLD